MVVQSFLRRTVLMLLPILVAGAAEALERPAVIEATVLETLEKFHGHTCAGSLMGARLGMAAKTALKAAGGEGKLKAKYFDHACPVDGIQVATGTTLGNRTIEIVDQNDQRLLLTAEKNGRQVEARLTKGAEEKAKRYRELKSRCCTLAVGSPERQRNDRAAEEIIAWFKAAADPEIVQVRVVK